MPTLGFTSDSISSETRRIFTYLVNWTLTSSDDKSKEKVANYFSILMLVKKHEKLSLLRSYYHEKSLIT